MLIILCSEVTLLLLLLPLFLPLLFSAVLQRLLLASGDVTLLAAVNATCCPDPFVAT
jgi:hypothetical protein